MNRGQNRNKIFHTDCHYQKFLSLLKDCVERWRWGCILKDLVGPIKRSRNISGDAPKHSFKCDPPLTRNWSKNVGDIESSFWQFNEMKMKTVFLWTWPLVPCLTPCLTPCLILANTIILLIPFIVFIVLRVKGPFYLSVEGKIYLSGIDDHQHGAQSKSDSHQKRLSDWDKNIGCRNENSEHPFAQGLTKVELHYWTTTH